MNNLRIDMGIVPIDELKKTEKFIKKRDYYKIDRNKLRSRG